MIVRSDIAAAASNARLPATPAPDAATTRPTPITQTNARGTGAPCVLMGHAE